MKLRTLASAVFAAAMLTVGLVTAALTTPAMAQRGNLVRMGEIEVDLKSGTATIDVSKARGSYGELRVYNRGTPIVLETVRVKYSDGSVHEERRRIDLRRGERTRAIDPGRANKFVDELKFSFKTGSARRPAKLVVYGVQDREGERAERPKGPKVAFPSRTDDRPSKSEDRKPPVPPPAAAPAKPAAAPAAAAPASAPKIQIQTAKAKDGRCVGEGNLLIARGSVGFGEDRDRLKVGGQFGKFDRIRLCVRDNDIELLDLTVNFANGSPLDLNYAGPIKSGSVTQAMSLKGDRFIDNIEIVYKKRENFSGRATVEVWGEVAEKWIDEEAELFNDGWVKLTNGDAVGFVGFELDKSAVRTHRKGFRQVRVVTRNRDITLDYIELIFADGKSQKIDAGRKKVEPNVGYGPVAIEGGPRVIKEVESRYRSRFFDKEAKGNDRAVVEIWAKR
ncbi:MAG: hypothetical protein AB7E80_06605 [Hyphomicrobiaceae bacterium]